MAARHRHVLYQRKLGKVAIVNGIAAAENKRRGVIINISSMAKAVISGVSLWRKASA